MIRALGVGLLESVFPPRCVACDAIGSEPFCRSCAAATEPGRPVPVPGADWVHAELAYGGPAADAIRRFKFHGRWELARPLGALMDRSVRRAPLCFERVVPIPTTLARLRDRGFNPARELARGWEGLAPPAVMIRRPGPSQVGQSRRVRWSNLREAFDADPVGVFDRSVLLVDDVITTGATAAATVEAARRSGARRVGFIALAQTPSMNANEQ